MAAIEIRRRGIPAFFKSEAIFFDRISRIRHE
jgi:hypothetical protein